MAQEADYGRKALGWRASEVLGLQRENTRLAGRNGGAAGAEVREEET